jgi:L-alanine-DL-glutamate epimerase-like enolase superfamily enzyme
MKPTIESIEIHPVELPFRETPRRHLRRELPQWRFVQIVEVQLTSGVCGFGETMPFYWSGRIRSADTDALEGRNPATLLGNSSLNFGLQMAIADALARHLEVPVSEVFATRRRDRVPIAWWCIDMSPADLASEGRRALESGYRALKMKGRPWFDLHDQLDALEAAVGDELAVGIDFNFTLLDANRALGVLTSLSEYEFVVNFEEPIPRNDAAGNRRLTEEVTPDVLLHYGNEDEDVEFPDLETFLPAETVLAGDVCDGFIMTNSVSTLSGNDAVLAAADMPFILQLVGTPVTTAHAVQLASVSSQATKPIVTCDHVYAEHPLAGEITPEDGSIPVSDGPGIGYEVDRSILEEYEEPIPDEVPSPPRIIESRWPDGRRLYVPGGVNSLLKRSWNPGVVPYFESGATTRLLPDDGSREWQQLRERIGRTSLFITADEALPAVARD